jgi:serine protease inhibitor
MMRTTIALPLLAVLLLGACGDIFRPAPETWSEIPLDARMVEGSTAFGLDLHRELAAAAPDRNLFVSPASVGFALLMTARGGRGDTREEILGLLGLSGMSDEEIGEHAERWMTSLIDPERRVELAVANSMWIRDGFEVRQPFIDWNRTHLLAEVAQRDFDNPATVREINDWVADATRGRITDLVAGLDPLDWLLLINALYFKADWTHAFDEGRTADWEFTRPDGSRVPVRMMSQRAKFRAYRTDAGHELVRLPYGSGRFEMVLALPAWGTDLPELTAALTGESLRGWLANERWSESEVMLPRFRMEWEGSLAEPLKALGMEIPFDPQRADFGEIDPEVGDLHVRRILQKTFVEVNERGTEAAAATKVVMGPTSAPPMVIFDRPFFFAIHDRATQTLLFTGQVTDPTAG